MTGVAEQHYSSIAPARQRLAFQDRPFMAIGTGFEHLADPSAFLTVYRRDRRMLTKELGSARKIRT